MLPRKSGRLVGNRIECAMFFRASASLVVPRLVIPLSFAATEHAANTVLLEELTWTELRDHIHSGKTTILVPIGGTEQNAPHMLPGKAKVRVTSPSYSLPRGPG